MTSISVSTIASWHDAILFRQPDDAALRFWQNELSGQNPDPTPLISSLLNSAEYANTVLPVMIFYQVGLGRIPDAEGLRYWSSALASGQNMASLAEAFTKTPEFGSLFGSGPGGPSNSNLIHTLFQKTFGREPSAAELTLWSSGGQNQSQLLLAFSQTQEALERFTESSHIISAYLAIEGQVPSQEQLHAAMNLGDVRQILSGLLIDAFPPEMDWFAGEPGSTDDSSLTIPTLTLHLDPLLSADLTARSSLSGVLLVGDQAIAEVDAEIPIALNDLPMLDTLTSAPLVAQSESGGRSAPTPQIVTFGTSGDDEFDAEDASTMQYVFTGNGNDRIYGGINNDYLSGGEDNDEIWGNDGNDVILGGAGADTLDGGDGIDTLIYSDVLSDDAHGIEGVTGIAINLAPRSLPLDETIGQLVLFNEFIGSEWLDLKVESLENQRFGSPADENPNLLEENSVAYLLSNENPGGAPRDSASNFEIIMGSLLDDLILTEGNYEIDGNNGNDIILSLGDRLQLRGGDGNDFILSSSLDLDVDGGSGDDIIFSFTIFGPFFDPDAEVMLNATITGGVGADRIFLVGGQNSIIMHAHASNGADEGSSDSNYSQQDRLSGIDEDDFFVLYLSNLRDFMPDDINFERLEGDFDVPTYLYSVNTNYSAEDEGESAINSPGDIRVLITNTLFIGSDPIASADQTILNLTGTNEADYLMGGVNPDVITGGLGADQLTGGLGADTFIYHATVGVSSDSSEAAQDRITDLQSTDQIQLNLTNVRNFSVDHDVYGGILYTVITGDSNSDIVIDLNGLVLTNEDARAMTTVNAVGTDEDDVIIGGAGTDTITGGDGNDRIEGGGEMDTINLGSGSNTIVFNAVAQIEAIEEEGEGEIGWSDSTTFAKDIVNGFDDDDYIVLNLYNLEDFLFEEDITVSLSEDGDYLYQVDTNYLASDSSDGAGDLEIIIRNPNNILDSVDLKDRTILNLNGTELGDHISGGINGDLIIGNNGDDVLDGDSGDDFLYGGDGDDAIDGGLGADYLSGGNGNDTFGYFDGSTGITMDTADTIADFRADEDLIMTGIEDYAADTAFRMEDGSALSNFTAFTGRANQAFSDGMSVFVAFNVGFLSGDGLSAINNDSNDILSAGDSLIVLVGITSESDISGANFIARVD